MRCSLELPLVARAASICGLLVLLVALTALPSGRAAEPSGDFADGQAARLEAYLAAGEFAPALRLAEQAKVPGERDQRLASLAIAQAATGSRGAARSTLARMHDDLARSEALKGVNQQPIRAYPARGGGQLADFDSIIDLITGTVDPDSWADAGGFGTIMPFPQGVYVDAEGVLNRRLADDADGRLDLLAAASQAPGVKGKLSRPSPLRKVSLPRLQRQAALRHAMGLPPTPAMKVLAGLERIRYVMVFPETRDLVLAGPAGPWQVDPQGRAVSLQSGRPLVRLDDVVSLFRCLSDAPGAALYVSINPREDRLAALQEHLAIQGDRRPASTSRDAWLDGLRQLLGHQDIVVEGLDPRTPAARVLIEADYHMKLVGLGIEPSVLGLSSYLDRVAQAGAGGPLDVLRWWFVLDYDAVLATADRHAFELCGRSVRLLSENELLNNDGTRVHTGEASALNAEFARSFTKHIDALAVRYPVYAELQNVFDIALVAALTAAQQLAEKAGWHMTHFGDPEAYQVPHGPAPRAVASVANYRVSRGRHVVAAVSGGVMVDPWHFVTDNALRSDDGERLESEHARSVPTRPVDFWWWD